MHREAFGLIGDGNAPVIYKCEIPDYWNEDLFKCIELGEHKKNGDGYPFGPWGLNPAIIVEAVELYDRVRAEWRRENGN
jgi:hypothetical protein